MVSEPYPIPGPWPGRLAIVPRPRGGDWLDDEVLNWRQAGIDVVVSLLEPAEATQLGLEREAELAAVHGLSFLNFPIPDRDIPTSQTSAHALLESLADHLAAGKAVAIHCRQSVGRSGMIAAALLIAAGMDPGTAIDTVSAARGLPVPETTDQIEWLHRLAPAAAR